MSKKRIFRKCTNFLSLLFCASGAFASSPLPEVDVPFVDTIVPPHRTLTARYSNPTKWSFVSCYCSDDRSCPVTVTWKLNDQIKSANLSVYIAIDTYNANHHGKLHFYNNSDRQDIQVRCYPEFEPPPRQA